MKRIIIILLFLISVCFFASALEEKLIGNNSKGFVLRGFIKQYCIVSVFPIQSEGSGSTGSPFDLLGNDVAYSTDPLHGRVIATWIVATNYSNRTLQITPGNLQNGAASLSYILKFRLSYKREESNGSYSTIVETIEVPSGQTTELSLENRSLKTGVNSPLLSTGENQTVLFMLDSNSDANKLNSSLVPDGTYNATVTFLLEGN